MGILGNGRIVGKAGTVAWWCERTQYVSLGNQVSVVPALTETSAVPRCGFSLLPTASSRKTWLSDHVL